MSDEPYEDPAINYTIAEEQEERKERRIPKWVYWVLSAVPILALWSVNVWAISDYVANKDALAKVALVQAVRDNTQDHDIKDTQLELERQRRVLCAIAGKLKVVSADCE